jgi:peptidoglycan hydrolase-like protein with peptidoglycan-binding domain
MYNQFIFESEGFEFNPNFEFENDEYGFESSYESLESETGRDSPDYVRWIQQALNRVLGLRLAVDGDIGPQTRSAIRSFQTQKGLTVDGIVGANTEAALIAAGGTRPPTSPTSGGGTSSAVNTRLPRSGQGFYGYLSNSRQYGLPETIRALQNIAAAWYISHPQGPRIGIGDISFQGGGYMPPHKSHQKGVDIDIRLMRNDGVEGGTRYQNPEYSRALTQELVNLIRANNVLSVRYIFFNDPQVRGVRKEAGHDNHLHVRFCAPNDLSCIRASQGEFEFESDEWETGNYESNPFIFEIEQSVEPTDEEPSPEERKRNQKPLKGRKRNERPPKEHTSNQTPSNKEKHEKGVSRKLKDKKGEKGDVRRLYQR